MNRASELKASSRGFLSSTSKIRDRSSNAALHLPNHSQMNITHVPGTTDTYYIPDFVTGDEEAYLLRKVSPTVVGPLDTQVNPPIDPGDTSAEMEATFESEVHVLVFMNPTFVTIPRCSTDGSCPAGYRRGVTRKSTTIKRYLRSNMLRLRW